VVLADGPTAALNRRLWWQVMEFFRQVAHEQRAGEIIVPQDRCALDVVDVICEMEDQVIRQALAGLAGTVPARLS